MTFQQALHIFQLTFNPQLESEYAQKRFEEGKKGFSTVLIVLAIINPPYIVLEFFRSNEPLEPVLFRVILELLILTVLVLNIRANRLNKTIYPLFYACSMYLVYLFQVFWAHNQQEAFYILFLPNITIVYFFVSASFTGLLFRQSAVFNLLILGTYSLFAYFISYEPLHLSQIPGLITLLVVCLLVSFLLEKFNRKLFLSHQEIKDKNETIERINGELKDRNELKNSLISVLSHDINSPLFSIKSLIQLSKEHDLPREEMLKYWNHIDQSVDRVLGFTKKTIEWVKKQSDSFQPNIQVVNVRKIVEEITELSNAQAQIKNIELSCSISELDEIASDEEVIRIGLRNLISNAIKFSHEGGKVALSSTFRNQEYLILVKDHGKGIRKERMDLLFSQHSSEPGTKNESGSGLGLSFSNMLMQQIGGYIEVESEVGKGSTFSLVFPIHQTQ